MLLDYFLFVSNVKNSTTIQRLKSNLLTIKAHSSFSQIYKKINNTRNPDFVLVKKAKASQMSALVLSRLAGKKFFWIQEFANPPTPGFFTRILLSQPDRIIIKSKTDFIKLKNFGIDKAKIRYQKRD